MKAQIKNILHLHKHGETYTTKPFDSPEQLYNELEKGLELFNLTDQRKIGTLHITNTGTYHVNLD